MSLLKTVEELEQLIESFESATLPQEDWRHQEHVEVAVWYLFHFELDKAISKMREGIKKLNSAHGVTQTKNSGYHETWTVFFMRVLHEEMKKNRTEATVQEHIGSSIEFLKDFKAITHQYYTPELITSWEARTSWVDPDLKSLK